MFESMTDRIAGTVLMGLDVAVEFATLGEYRLVEADALPSPDDFQPAPLVRRPSRTGVAVEIDRRLLPPASTAIARAAAESAARAAARRGGSRPAAFPRTLTTGQLPAGKAVVPSAPRRRSATARAGSAVGAAGFGAAKPAPRKRAGAVEAGTQLCLFGR
jgi:hypothetical protein